jgi:predicted ATP-binding protein involved in virulence
MPLTRLIAEGVGPFHSLDIDLSDGHGNPHVGPHILAGVNGSGKSTILRTIAWVFDRGERGFQYDDWSQALGGYDQSRALVVIHPPGMKPYVRACSKGIGDAVGASLLAWTRSVLSPHGFDREALQAFHTHPRNKWAAQRAWFLRFPEGTTRPNSTWMHFSEEPENAAEYHLFNYAAYSPSKSLSHLANPDLTSTLSDWTSSCLGFEYSVQNASIQSWLLSLYSKRAIARERSQSGDEYTHSLERFEAALKLIYDQNVSFDVEIEPRFQPRLRMMGKNLNFSQLPDGVRSTVAWVADFMMRQDLVKWDPSLGGKRPGFLLLDEVDAHLHPFWQRRLLPAMRSALPDVQIIATSHSPFVISSCPDSRIHVLELDKDGFARPRSPINSPIGESVVTTLKEIFGVESRFDILTERELNEWNELKRDESGGALSDEGRRKLESLTITLSERSEELRSIVASPRSVPKSVLESLLGADPRQPATVKHPKRKVLTRR